MTAELLSAQGAAVLLVFAAVLAVLVGAVYLLIRASTRRR